MALINCYECSGEMSTAASACPKCGAPSKAETTPEQPKKTAKTRPFFKFLGGVLVFLFILAMVMSNNPKPDKASDTAIAADGPVQAMPTAVAEQAGPPGAASNATAGVADSQDWQFIEGEDDGSFFMMDFASIVTDGGLKKAWVQANFLTPQPLPSDQSKKFRSIIFQYLVGCEKKELGPIKITAYERIGALGDVVMTQNLSRSEKTWSEATPGSLGANIVQMACNESARAQQKQTNAGATQKMLEKAALFNQ